MYGFLRKLRVKQYPLVNLTQRPEDQKMTRVLFTWRALLVSVMACSSFVCGGNSAATIFSVSAPSLPSYQVDLTQTSVSGLSSGAFMATQFHIAFSKTVLGAGIIAGGPYYCVGASPLTPLVDNAVSICQQPLQGLEPNAKLLFEQAKGFAKKGEIDRLENLKRSRVYLFTGLADNVVASSVVDQTEVFYRLAGLPLENFQYIKGIQAGHALVTKRADMKACDANSAPYINNCGFDQSHDILRHIYGELHPPSVQLSGRLMKFNQRGFVSSWFSSMSDEAYVYVPKSCETKTCKVHVVFHGCEQGAQKIGDLFVTASGYNELADSNQMIVLYPQVESSRSWFLPSNPFGCWDFWGYTRPLFMTPDFYTKRGSQMAAVMAMLQHLAQARGIQPQK